MQRPRPAQLPQIMSFVQVVGNFNELQKAYFALTTEDYEKMGLLQIGKQIASPDFWIKILKTEELKVKFLQENFEF